MKDPGWIAALTVALIVAALYSQGGAFQTFASLILLAVLLTPVDGQQPIAAALLNYLYEILTHGVNTPPKPA